MPALVATQRCPLCERDAALARELYPPGPAGVGISRCERCGLAFATSGVKAADLGAEYDPRDPDDGAVSAGRRVRPGVARRWARLDLYDRLSHHRIRALHPGSRALDIGCNTGLLLDALRELGYRTDGIERSAAAAEASAAGHRIHRADIEGASELGVRFDLITMTHVLEQLRRPVAALKWVRRHLAPGGLAIVEVPNFDDLARERWGLAYRPLELGAQLSFFDRKTLGCALERAELTTLELWSAPQAGSLLFPSLLSGVDLSLGLFRRLRGGHDPSPSSAGLGRVRGRGTLGRLTERLLGNLDRVDPALEEFFGAECAWGANLVALVSLAN